MSTQLNEQAQQQWRTAQNHENQNNYTQAIHYYKNGCKMMMQWLPFDQIETRKKGYISKMKEILDHVEKLKELDNKVPVPAQGGQQKSNQNKSDKDQLSQAIQQSIVKVKPTISFKDVAGLDIAKQALEEAVIMPYKFPQLFQGKREPWRAILLYGVPGTGKTYIAKALAAECDMTFFSISSSDLISKYQGESERLVSSLFELARQEERAVIFIDEIDSLLSARGGGDENESSKRVKTEFMVQMQGVGNNNKGILILAATNFPENLDPAIRRRFEKKIEITLPEWVARKQILLGCLNEIDTTIQASEIDQFEQLTEFYSASDLSTACKDAIMQPVREMSKSNYFYLSNNKYCMCDENQPGAVKKRLMEFNAEEQALVEVPKVEARHLREAIMTCKKTVSKADISRINKFTQEFGTEG
ncbi:Vacuolar protein sorting 4b [Spironucleus salmonicida]|uniref:Topoisomerase II n=1 Tax=Spironucleus salmonicida TaxID=348837 RepID=V6LM12_9EUKA|nr:Vacuolar protein sorting 4b [Spironucleus salmonicida]|eukprot:EST45727.1 Topoisomerase II [Spironucleus salmonicida]